MTQTSKDAYRKLSPVKVVSEEQQILAYLYDAGCPVNDREISQGTGLAKNVVWSRRSSLENKKKIVYAGNRLDAETGNYVMTWKLQK